jgi:hypothetical protein
MAAAPFRSAKLPQRRAGAQLPPAHRLSGIWRHPVPAQPECGPSSPLWWWVGAHGGAGVSALTSIVTPSGDARRRWPCGDPSQSTAVVIVARTHHRGLSAAQDLLAQHAAGGVPEAVDLLGLVTVADAPGKLPQDLRRYRDLVATVAPAAWHLPWVQSWRVAAVDELPQWEPGMKPMPGRSRRKGEGDHWQPPPEYINCAQDIFDAAAALAATRSTSG